MGVKSFVMGFAGDMGKEILGELFGANLLKNMMAKVMKGRGTVGMKVNEAKELLPEMKQSDLVHMSDEIAFFNLIGKMEQDPELKGSALNTSVFINNYLKEAWQKQNFRVVMGALAGIEYDVHGGETQREKIPRKGKSPIEREKITPSKKVNLGVQVMKSFAALNSDEERLEVCKASGIMDPSRGVKIKNFIKDHPEEAIAGIKKIRKEIQKPYKGFWRELLSLPTKKTQAHS